MKLSEICLLSWLTAGLLLCGCGGEDVPQPAKRAALAPPRVPVGAAQDDQKAEQTEERADDEEMEFDPSVDPHDVFVVVDELPTFEVIGLEPKVKASDVFAVTVPQPGENSSTFVIVEKGKRPSVGEPNPDLQLPSGFSPIAEAGYSDAGFPLRIRCGRDASVMALVPAGQFIQGHNGDAPEAGPEHSLFLDAYYIDVSEVTVGQYAMFRNSRKKMKRRIPAEPLNASAPESHPVLGVLWGDATAYAAWAGKSLPTEAEWEKAARGEHGLWHPWGNGRAIWPRERSTSQIDPVRSFRTDMSKYGVFDLAGNAREWCLDWFSDEAYRESAALSETRRRNWKGPREASPKYHRVVKGNGPNWRAWHRSGVSMRERPADVGFRCVLRADPSTLRKKPRTKSAEKLRRRVK